MSDKLSQDEIANRKKLVEVLNQLFENIMSLKRTSSLAISIFDVAHRNEIKKLEGLVKQGAGELITRESRPYYHLTNLDRGPDWFAVTTMLKNLDRAQVLTSRSLLVSLVSQWDNFFARTISAFSNLQPAKFKDVFLKVSLENLDDFSSLDQIRQSIIQSDIDSVMYKSHEDQLKWFSEKTDIGWLKEKQSWSAFTELTERRNLFVHNDGVVNKKYLQACLDAKFPIGSVKENEIISVSKPYFDGCCDNLIEIASKLIFSIWRKHLSDDIEGLFQATNNFLVELITQEEYQVAIQVANFALQNSKKPSDATLTSLQLNHSQAYRWMGNIEEARKILESIDWTAKGSLYLMCKNVLLDDFEAAKGHMLAFGVDAYCGREAYTNWPIFKEFRKTNEFKEAFQTIFGENVAADESGYSEP